MNNQALNEINKEKPFNSVLKAHVPISDTSKRTLIQIG